MKKRAIRMIAIIMAVVMVFTVVYGTVTVLTAKAATQAQIDALKNQQKELSDKKKEVQSKINSKQYEKSSVMARKSVLDERIDLTEQEIDNISEQIATYVQLIADKEEEVNKAQAAEDAQWERYKERMRIMEENGAISYLALIFQASSFVDLLARIDMIGEIMSHDERVYQDLETA